MKYISIPGTDLKPAKIVMGSICSIEGPADDAYRILDMYRDAGGNILDSANVYGKFFKAGTNVCDENIGRWLKERGCRDDFIVETKGGHPDPSRPGIKRLKREDVLADIEESLRALQTDEIDLFFLHRDDESIPAGEIVEYLNEFKKQGKIRYFGVSNWRAGRIREAEAYAREHGIQGFSVDQTLWSMAEPDMRYYPWEGCTNMDSAAYEMHEQTGMAAFAYESQARGFFQKYHKGGKENVPENLYRLYWSEKNIGRYERALDLAEEKGLSLTAVVLLYLLNRPFPSCALIGPRTQEQYLESMEAADKSLTKGEIRYIETGK